MAAAAAACGFKSGDLLSIPSNLKGLCKGLSLVIDSGLLGVLGGVNSTEVLPSLSTRIENCKLVICFWKF